MNVFKKYIIQIFAATIFSMALLLPTAVQYVHAFEGHEHKTCKEITTHLHEEQLDCSIYDFHFSTFNFTPFELPDFRVFHNFQIVETAYVIPELDLNPTHYLLRGPPSLS